LCSVVVVIGVVDVIVVGIVIEGVGVGVVAYTGYIGV
jgi:hypothetical protein